MKKKKPKVSVTVSWRNKEQVIDSSAKFIWDWYINNYQKGESK